MGMKSTERRLDSRFLCADLVSAVSAQGTIEAVLEDISAFGACIQTESAVPVGTEMTLLIGYERFSGRVCYCAYRDYGYFIGVRFREEDEWSEALVSPQHLISLEKFSRHAP